MKKNGNIFIIPNADDFGLSDSINKGIIESHINGILGSTSICVNGAAFEEAVSLANENPELDIGVHLTIVEEKPLLSPDKISSLVDENGSFYNNANTFLIKYLLGKINFDEVKDEFYAQISKVRDTGLQISHIDSHQHLHVLPQMYKITVELAEHFGIKIIRNPREKIRPYMFREKSSLFRIFQLGVLNSICRYKVVESKYSITNHMVGFLYGGNLNKENLLKILKNLPSNGIFELMCHPGSSKNENKYKHWNYKHVDELNALTHSEVIEYIEMNKIKLIKFKEIGKNFEYKR